MKVVHLSAADSSVGAGIACVKLHEALLLENVQSHILFLQVPTTAISHTSFYETTSVRRIVRKVYTIIDRILLKYYPKRKAEIFSPGLVGIDLSRIKEVQEADLIHLHWVNHAFVDIKDLVSLDKPVVWTMHDCWVFTGGCHYFSSCDRFKVSCGSCVVLQSSQLHDLSYYVLQRKAKYYSKLNIQFVAISSWMRDQAKSSILLCNEKVAILPSGIDCSIFNYKGESKCKQDFNLRKDDTVVLLGAQHLSSPFKGVQLSIDALNKYIDKPLTVLTFGGGEVVLSNPLHKVINYGFVSNATAMAKLYGVADVFLCTSVAEGFGMTVAEAQCCGTPAVAFEQTGPSDIIVHKKSGYLAKFKEVSDVVLGLSFCLEAHFDREALARDAAQKFSIINCAKRYVSLYEEVIYEE